jgi:hypothetical protein
MPGRASRLSLPDWATISAAFILAGTVFLIVCHV